jgi:hypothetical protein
MDGQSTFSYFTDPSCASQESASLLQRQQDSRKEEATLRTTLAEASLSLKQQLAVLGPLQADLAAAQAVAAQIREQRAAGEAKLQRAKAAAESAAGRETDAHDAVCSAADRLSSGQREMDTWRRKLASIAASLAKAQRAAHPVLRLRLEETKQRLAAQQEELKAEAADLPALHAAAEAAKEAAKQAQRSLKEGEQQALENFEQDQRAAAALEAAAQVTWQGLLEHIPHISCAAISLFLPAIVHQPFSWAS